MDLHPVGSLPAMRRLVEHWWNGLWGRMNRRDIWLYRHDDIPDGSAGAWTLRVHNGWHWDREWPYADEGLARANLRVLLDTNDSGEFREVG